MTAARGGVALGVVMPGLVRGAGEDCVVFCSPWPLSGTVVSLSVDAVETGWYTRQYGFTGGFGKKAEGGIYWSWVEGREQ